MYIYALIDPRTGFTRYIGKTNKPSKRIYGHLQTAKLYPLRPLGLWIQELIAANYRPLLQILEINPNWEEAERSWIAYGREAGCDLLNQLEGGNGPSDKDREVFRKLSLGRPGPNKDRKFSDEVRKRMSQSRLGSKNPMYGVPSPNTGKQFSQEHRDKIAQSRIGAKNPMYGKPSPNKGKTATEEQRAKIRESWKRRKDKYGPSGSS